MAKQVFNNAFISVNGTDLSNRFKSVSVEGDIDTGDATAMGSQAKETVLGLPDAKITGTVYLDFAAASVDAVLWPLFSGRTSFVVEVRPVNAARSATNPAYTLTSFLPTYHPIQGDASSADAGTTDVEFVNAAQVGLQRLTA